MHELGIAQEIASKVISEAEKMKAKSVVSVDLEVGDLSFLDPANMEMWIEGRASGQHRQGCRYTDRRSQVESNLQCLRVRRASGST